MADTNYFSVRAEIYHLLEPKAWHRRGLSIVNIVLIVLILLSFLALSLETEPTMSPAVMAGISVFNNFVVGAFALEYAIRLWAAGADPAYAGVFGRFRYALQPTALADLVAFLPELIVLLLLRDIDGAALMALRALRVLRLFKIARYVPAFGIVAAVLHRVRAQLLASLAVATALVYVSAVTIYFVEGPVQPDKFGSVPRALWWSVVTLTTVGYGDVFPVTALGRIAASVVLLAGIGVVAMPTGIIAAAFTDEFREREERRRALLERMQTDVRLAEPPPDPKDDSDSSGG